MQPTECSIYGSMTDRACFERSTPPGAVRRRSICSVTIVLEPAPFFRGAFFMVKQENVGYEIGTG